MKTHIAKKYIKKALKFLNEDNWTRNMMVYPQDAIKIDEKCSFCISGAAAYFYLKAQKKEKITRQKLNLVGADFNNVFKDKAKYNLITTNDLSSNLQEMKNNVIKIMKRF